MERYYHWTYPTRKTHRSKSSGNLNMPEWCMGSYNNAGEAIVEDEEGIKLRLKQMRPTGSALCGNIYNYW